MNGISNVLERLLGVIAPLTMDGDSILEAMDCGAPSGVEQPTASTAVTDCWSEPVKVSDFVAKFEGNRYADESALVYRKLGVSFWISFGVPRLQAIPFICFSNIT